MRSYRDYKNYSMRARIIAWLMDLTLKPLYRVLTLRFFAITPSAKPFSVETRAEETSAARTSGARAPNREARASVTSILRAPASRASADEKFEKILLVRLDHIGDLLMATPAIAALRRKFPEARIDLLGGERAAAVFKGNPDIDHIGTFNAPWYDPRRGGEIWPVDVVATILRLRKIGYEAIVDMRGDFRVIFLFLWLAGAGRRMGFRNLGLDFLLTDSIDYDPQKSYMELNYDALSFFGIDRSDRKTKFFVSGEDELYVDKLLVEHGIIGKEEARQGAAEHRAKETAEERRALAGDILVGINPTTNRVEQRWQERRFAELADRLVEEFGARIILIAAEADAGIVELVQKQMKHRVVNLTGKTDLHQLGALLKRLTLYIANDSGPVHLCVSLGTPAIGIFGTTSVQRSWPYGFDSPFYKAITADVDCQRPCYRRDCEDMKCFDLITVEEVYRAAAEILRVALSLRK